MDSYQAVYDAVCSRLRNTDVGEAIRSACHVDASHAIVMLQQEFSIAAYEMQRPERAVSTGRISRWPEVVRAVRQGFADGRRRIR